MTLREVWTALRARIWLVLLSLVVGTLVALGASLLQTPLYSSSTELFVSTTDSATTSDVFQGGQFSQQRVASYAKLLTGEELATRVIDQLHLPLSPKELQQEITATPVSETVLIDVTVTDPSPQRAYRIADSVGTQFAGLVDELESTGQRSGSPVKVSVTDHPQVPDAPSSPKTNRNVALGALVGLLVGAAAAIGRKRLDRTVKERKQAAELAGAPVIGAVMRDEMLAKQHVIDRASLSGVAEDFRQLRAALQFLDVDNPPKVIMVSSPMPAEGKTTVVINLALALGEVGQRVAVVEADLRRSRLVRYLGLVSGVGLTNVLAGTAELGDVAQPFGEGRVSLVGAGPTPPNPGQLLASDHMSTLIEELRKTNDYVLIDAPPLLPVADSTGLAALVDGVLLSLRYGKTRKDQLQQAVARVEQVGGRVLGIILNIVPPKAEEAGAYGYGYEYRYAEEESRRARRRQGGRRRAGRRAGTPVSDITS